MTDFRRTHGIGRMLLLALVALGLVGALGMRSAEARHEVELAEGLARDFQFFDLAKQILDKELEKARATNNQSYLATVAWTYAQVLNLEAEHAVARGDLEAAERLRTAARQMMTENAGTGARAEVTRAGATLQEALALVRAAESATDVGERERMRNQALTMLRTAFDQFHKIVLGNLLLYFRDELTDEAAVEALRSAWYYWAQTAYELAKLGEENVTYKDPSNPTNWSDPQNTDYEERTQTYIELVIHQMGQLQLAFDGTFVSFWAMMLTGDAHSLAGNYGLAIGQYDSILSSVPRVYPTAPGETPPAGVQEALDNLRMDAYHKTALAYLKEGNDARVIRTVDAMLADYPSAANAMQIKLGRLLKAEAMVRLILVGDREGTLADVIAEVQPLANDPEAYFRYKYNEMLTNIGLAPRLDLDMRMDCARAAFSIGKLNEAAQIYRLVLESLRVDIVDPRTGDRRPDVEASQRRFEAYAPEAYWYIGMSLAGQGRHMEAGMVFYRASRLFTYFATKFREVDQPLPEHMLTEAGTPRFHWFETTQRAQSFPIDLALRANAAINTWSPAGQAGNDPNTRHRVPGAVEDTWTRRVVPGATWGSRDALDVSAHAQAYQARLQREEGAVYRLLAQQGWAFQRDRSDEQGYGPAITMLTYVEPSVGPRIWNATNNMLAELMRREYNRRVEVGIPDGVRGDPFPEGDTAEFPREVLSAGIDFARGAAFWTRERDRIGRAILANVPSRQREEVRDLLDLIARYEQRPAQQRAQAVPGALIWEESLPRDARLLFWYKARYYHLRFFYSVVAAERSAIERIEPQAFERSLGELMSVWAQVQQERLRTTSNREERTRIRELVSDVGERIYFYGMLLRNNPWSGGGRDMRNGYLGDRPEAEEFSADLAAQALDVWHNYHGNYAVGFEFPDDEQRSERAQRVFQQRVRDLLYLAFFLHRGMRNPAAAEEVLREFERLYPESVRAEDAQLRSRYDEFVSRLQTSFDVATFEARRRLQTSVEKLTPYVATLRADGAVSLTELRAAAEQHAVLLRVERERDQPLICLTDEEVLIGYLATLVERTTNRAYRTEHGAVDEAGLLTYLARHPRLLENQQVVRDGQNLAHHLQRLASLGHANSEPYQEYLLGPMRTFLLEQVAAHREELGEAVFDERLKLRAGDRVYRDRARLLGLLADSSPIFGEEGPMLEIQELDVFATPLQRRLEELANESLRDNTDEVFDAIHRQLRVYHHILDEAPQATFTPQANGEHTLVVTSFTRGATGSYTVTILRRRGSAQPEVERLTGSLTAAGETGGSRQSHVVSLRRGEMVTVVVRSEDFLPHLIVEGPEMEPAEHPSAFAAFISDLRTRSYVGEHHPIVLQMHIGYQKRVYLQRFQLAEALQRLVSEYSQLVIALDGKSLHYTYLVQLQRGRDELLYNDWRETGLRFFQAGRWAPAIEYLTEAVNLLERNQGFRNFTEAPPLDSSAPDNRTLGREIEYRYFLGHASLELAQREGSYNPNGEHWRNAQTHLSRLYSIINDYNHRRQNGFTGRILYQRQLERFYYATLQDLVTLHTAIARQHQQTGDLEAARESLEMVSGVYSLIATQSPMYSPDERIGRYHTMQTWYEIARLANGQENNRRLVRAWNDLRRIYQGRHPEAVVLDGDVTYDAAMDALYLQVLELATERGLEIERPMWEYLDQR